MVCVTNTVDRRAYLYGFSRIKGIGPVRIRLLQSHFGSLEEAWCADTGALLSSGLESRLVSALAATRARMNPQEELTRVEQTGIQVLTWDDPAYPKLLRQIADPPPVLYVRGTLVQEDEYAVGV